MGALDVRTGATLPGLFPPGSVGRNSSRLSGVSIYLAIVALTAAMFPRLLTAAGAPALVKFLHFPITLAAVMIVAPRIRDGNSKQLLGSLYVLLLVTLASAFVNGAGVVNALLSFVLLAEPFLLVLLLTGSQMAPDHLRHFRNALLAIASIHIALAYYQYFALGLRSDDVKGVFLAQGAGHHVAGAVALTTAAYLLTSTVFASARLRVAVSVACAAVVYFTDAKQVSLVFFVSFVFLSFRRAHAGTIARRLGIAGLACALFLAVAQWFLPQLVSGAGSGSLANVHTGLRHKLSVFPLLESHFRSPLNWFLGLGPGHTCGRLGELIPDYRDQLEPLGVTTSSVTNDVIRLRESNRLSRTGGGSSLWSPFFFWSGLTGDLGLAGVACIITLWTLVAWHRARDDLARFLTINALLFGVVFSWLEEPGYTMFVMAVIGLLYQESLYKGGGSIRRPLRPSDRAATGNLR